MFRMMMIPVCALLLALCAAGCGDDSDGAASADQQGASTAGDSDTSGAEDSTGAGMNGEAGSAAPAMAAVMCGGVMCTESVDLGGTMLGPCCDTDSGDICGAGAENPMTGELECEGLDQPGELSPDCPDAMSVFGTTLAGCCKPDGMCGVMSNVGYGCVERSDQNPTSVMNGPLESIACGT
jgi:hypothetical protein